METWRHGEAFPGRPCLQFPMPNAQWAGMAPNGQVWRPIQNSKLKTQMTYPLKRLLSYGRKYRGLIWQASAYSIFNRIFGLTPPVLIGAGVDVVVQKENSLIANLGVSNVLQQFLILSLIALFLWLCESLLEYAYSQAWRNLSQTIQHDLRLDAYARLQELDLAYFEERSTGTVVSVLSDDINQLERFLDNNANEIIQVLTAIIFICGAFFLLDPSIAWISFVPIPFIAWLAIWFQKLLGLLYAKVREKLGVLNGQLTNNISGITTIKSFTAEDYEISRIDRLSDAYRQSNKKVIFLSSAFIPLLRIVILLGFTGILVYGGIEAVEGRLAVGTYSTMVFLTQRLLWLLARFAQILDQYQRAMASIDRVMDVLDTPVATHPGDKPLPIESVKGELEFRDVAFAYHQGFPVVENLSLKIPAGKTIGIVGSTGSGKSTLVKLLLRLYEVRSGSIALDRLELQDIQLRDLRQAIGLVSQDVFLFHGTVAENIAYGSLDLDLKKAIAPEIIETMAKANDRADNQALEKDLVGATMAKANDRADRQGNNQALEKILVGATIAKANDRADRQGNNQALEKILAGATIAKANDRADRQADDLVDKERDINLEKIIAAATIAEAHDFIMQLPQGYDTIVGERGQKLSGGQRQRISIARAILKNPPILILDEATSAVDNETEAAISRSLERITQNRTTIAIAHRLSTVRNADFIYVLEKGRLVEEGTHEQLLEQSGIYASLWQVQTGSSRGKF
ncbi:MAG: ABC transporter ATP-binding protein [Oscillatoria sp. SIO1A7]|nr:ABC transporter ATP-binding protein [Oscillatoria sp. SIO1A7]